MKARMNKVVTLFSFECFSITDSKLISDLISVSANLVSIILF